ncbi:MAG: hypothetical protein Q4D76_19555 [Oscillospiraceae bacterium]|nr:hypothetical protein [Oscillospiraceae bacterium]
MKCGIIHSYFPLDSEVKFLDPGSENEENEILEKDIYFEICGERFHNDYNSYTDKKKDGFLHDFENMCKDIRNTMDSLLTNGSITNDEYH